MPDASYFRVKARRCRELAAIATVSEVKEQLAVFADEFEAQADALEQMASSEQEAGSELLGP